MDQNCVLFKGNAEYLYIDAIGMRFLEKFLIRIFKFYIQNIAVIYPIVNWEYNILILTNYHDSRLMKWYLTILYNVYYIRYSNHDIWYYTRSQNNI